MLKSIRLTALAALLATEGAYGQMTLQPSWEPSAEPSMEHSDSPSLEVSATPTLEPSYSPTLEPSQELSVSPTMEVVVTIVASFTLSDNPDDLACSEDLQMAFADSAGAAVCDAAGLTDEGGECVIVPETTITVDDSSVDCEGIGEGPGEGPEFRRRLILRGRRLEVDAEYTTTLAFTETDAEEAGVDTSGDFVSDVKGSLETALEDAESTGGESSFLQSFEAALVEEVDDAGGNIDGFDSTDANNFSETVAVSDVDVEVDDGDDDDDDDDDDGLSVGAIAGIVVGAVAGSLIIGGLVWYFLVRKPSEESTRII